MEPAGDVVTDLFSGVSFALGLVAPRAGPVVPGVFEPSAAPAPVAGPDGDVLVADLFSGAIVFGLVVPTAGCFAPCGNGLPSLEPGSALSFGSVVGDTLLCNVVGGVPF